MKYGILFPVLILAGSGCNLSEPVPPIAAPASSVSLPDTFAADGYRYSSDVCHLVGESALTVDLMDDSYDLVACPEDITLIGNLAGARELDRIQGYRLFSVPPQ